MIDETVHTRILDNFRDMVTQCLCDFLDENIKYEVICDKTNNGPAIIKEGKLVVDIHVLLPKVTDYIDILVKVPDDK